MEVKPKDRRKVSPPKVSLTPTLVNKVQNHAMGAYMGHRLYDESICEAIPALYVEGQADVEVAVAIGISKRTFYDWCNQYPEFKAAVDYGKALAERWWQQLGREGTACEREVQPKLWEINMRNRFGYDQREEIKVVPLAEVEDNIRKVAVEKLESKLNDY